jgi:hypothetical protein
MGGQTLLIRMGDAIQIGVAIVEIKSAPSVRQSQQGLRSPRLNERDLNVNALASHWHSVQHDFGSDSAVIALACVY